MYRKQNIFQLSPKFERKSCKNQAMFKMLNITISAKKIIDTSVEI